MTNIGFSSGSIALDKFQVAVDLLIKYGITSIELSNLREDEVPTFFNNLDNLELSKFQYISYHAPSRLNELSEEKLLDYLHQIKQKKWNIVVHPDIITNFEIWNSLGENLLIENMDKRKSIGRTMSSLESIFEKLPNANLCFDIAHAYQIDSTMIEAIKILKRFKNKIKQIHISSLNSESKHEALTMHSMFNYKFLMDNINISIPFIIESCIYKNQIPSEYEKVKKLILGSYNPINNDGLVEKNFNKLSYKFFSFNQEKNKPVNV